MVILQRALSTVGHTGTWEEYFFPNAWGEDASTLVGAIHLKASNFTEPRIPMPLGWGVSICSNINLCFFC
jgi:hypothetical protein